MSPALHKLTLRSDGPLLHLAGMLDQSFQSLKTPAKFTTAFFLLGRLLRRFHNDRRRGPPKASVEKGIRGGDAGRSRLALIGHDPRQDAKPLWREHTSGGLQVCDNPGTSARVAGDAVAECAVGAPERLFRPANLKGHRFMRQNRRCAPSRRRRSKASLAQPERMEVRMPVRSQAHGLPI